MGIAGRNGADGVEDSNTGIASIDSMDGAEDPDTDTTSADGLDGVDNPDTSIARADIKEDGCRPPMDGRIVVRYSANRASLCSFRRFILFYFYFLKLEIGFSSLTSASNSSSSSVDTLVKRDKHFSK